MVKDRHELEFSAKEDWLDCILKGCLKWKSDICLDWFGRKSKMSSYRKIHKMSGSARYARGNYGLVSWLCRAELTRNRWERHFQVWSKGIGLKASSLKISMWGNNVVVVVVVCRWKEKKKRRRRREGKFNDISSICAKTKCISAYELGLA